MRILQINKFFYRRGGSEAYLFDLINLLEKKGHEVAVFSMADERNEKTRWSKYFIQNIDFSRPEGFFCDLKKAGHFLYSTEAAKKLEKLIIDFQPEVAHLHNISHQLTPSILLVLKKHNIPVVQTLHDYALICPNYRLYTRGDVCERCFRKRYYQAVFNRCVRDSIGASLLSAVELSWSKLIGAYNSVATFISPSRFLAEKIKTWGIKNPVEILSNFIDLEKFNLSHNFSDHLLYVGRLEKEKGIMTLLEAMEDLPEVKLKIVGTGALNSAVQGFINRNQLINVELVGFKPKEEVKKYLAGAQALVIPSQWYENNPISVLETMVMGKPIIGANIGGIPELVDDGQTGYLYNYLDKEGLKLAIRRLYNQRDLILKLGQNGRQKAEKMYNKESHYEKLMRIYNNATRMTRITSE